MTPFVILMHAIDCIWNDKDGWTLRERVAACNLLWEVAIKL